MNIEVVPMQIGLGLGDGINILTGEPKTPLLQSIDPVTWSGDDAGGGLVPDDFTWNKSFLVETQESYTSTLDVAASANGSSWSEDGEAKVSASVQYLKSQSFADTEIGFLIGRTLMTSYSAPTHEQMTALQLPAAAKQLAASDPASFVDNYGTHVVVGFTYGGYFFGSLTIRAGSRHDKDRLHTALAVEINDFEMANGKFTTDFASTVKTMNSWYEATPDSTLFGSVQGTYPLDTIDQMQAFVDQHFEPNLKNSGAGEVLSAVCFAWDMFGDVHTIPGYTSQMLTLNIDETAMDLLKEESRRLDYALTTASDMQNTNCWIGPQGSYDLAQVKVRIANGKQAIIDLAQDLGQLQKITVDDVQQYLVSESCLQSLAELASGGTRLMAQYYLDGAFTPNTVSDPGEAGQWSGQAQPTVEPQPQPSLILTAQHGDGSMQLGYTYQLEPADPNDLDPATVSLQDQPPPLAQQVCLEAYLQGPKSKPTNGHAMDGTVSGQWSTASWDLHNYTFNKIGVSWGFAAD